MEPASPKKGIGDLRGPAQRIGSLRNELNRAIVSALDSDGRRPFSDIAQHLGVSEGTIRNRIHAMKEAGNLRIVAVTNPVAREYQADAIIGIRVTSRSTPEAVATRLVEDDRVVYVLWVGGRFDLLIEVVADSRERFLEFLETKIYGATDISGAEVMLGLKNFKNQFLLKRRASELE